MALSGRISSRTLCRLSAKTFKCLCNALYGVLRGCTQGCSATYYLCDHRLTTRCDAFYKYSNKRDITTVISAVSELAVLFNLSTDNTCLSEEGLLCNDFIDDYVRHHELYGDTETYMDMMRHATITVIASSVAIHIYSYVKDAILDKLLFLEQTDPFIAMIIGRLTFEEYTPGSCLKQHLYNVLSSLPVCPNTQSKFMLNVVSALFDTRTH